MQCYVEFATILLAFAVAILAFITYHQVAGPGDPNPIPVEIQMWLFGNIAMTFGNSLKIATVSLM